MLAAALEDEVAAYIAAHAAERDEAGRRLVVRNGHARPRQVTTAAGAVEVAAPRVNDKRTDPVMGERAGFSSAILPPWCRKSPKVTEVLPLLYLHGLSCKDFIPALEQFLGSGAGLSASAITKLTEAWQEEYRRWCERDLSGADYVYVWADGLHFAVRLDADRVCTLVVVGVRADGKKELVALADGAPRVHRVLGRAAARRQASGHARPGTGGRRRRAGVLGRAAGGVPRDPARPLPDAQAGQRSRLPAEIGPARGPQGPRADPRRRGPRAR
jgi:Transposase, Mutator family